MRRLITPHGVNIYICGSGIELRNIARKANRFYSTPVGTTTSILSPIRLRFI